MSVNVSESVSVSVSVSVSISVSVRVSVSVSVSVSVRVSVSVSVCQSERDGPYSPSPSFCFSTLACGIVHSLEAEKRLECHKKSQYQEEDGERNKSSGLGGGRVGGRGCQKETKA